MLPPERVNGPAEMSRGPALEGGSQLLPLVFDSLTGNVRRLAHGVQQLCGAEVHEIRGAAPPGGFVLMTYTFGTGEVPASTAQFLALHGHGLRGVVVSGSFHWGERFGRAGDVIAAQYGVPLIARVNKSGNAADRETVAGWLLAQAHTEGQRAKRSFYGTLD
ncbi:class Ib ribonucleoside-diphosphate reductase assembly flavoprotein NrdI [Deinococcus sp. UYEF24]